MPLEFPSIQSLLMAPLKHKFKAALAFILPLVLATLAISFLPKAYRSDAMIFVRLGRESVSLDPTATTGSTISVLESRENEVNSIRDMLYSGGLIEKVVDRIGPEVVLGDEPLGEIPEDFPEAPETDIKNSPRQKAIKFLGKKLTVIAARKSSVLVPTCEAASPKLAQKILEVYLDAYKQMHSMAHQTPKSNEFFGQQAELLQEQWQTSMDKLRSAKEAADIVSIEGMQENLKDQTNLTQTRLMNVEAELMATDARQKTLQKMSSQPMNARGTREDLQIATASLASLTAERDTLKTQIGELLERGAKLNRDEVTIRQLEEQVSVAKTNFAQYQELYEQTRIEEALLSNKFTNVRIVQDPSFVPKQVSPKRSIIAAVGLFAGITGAILLPALLEIFLRNNPFRPTSSGRRVIESEPADVSIASQGSLI